MTNNDLIEIDIAVLLLRYGKQPVLSELARQLGTSAVELQRLIERTQERRRASNMKRRSPYELEPSLLMDAERADLLVALKGKFDNRTFLPDLRDVKRFLEKNGLGLRSVKSRDAAQRALFATLARQEPKALRRLLEDASGKDTVSSLGLISDEILKNVKSRPQ